MKSPIAALWATGRGGYSNGTDVFEELMPSPHRTSRRLLRVTAGLMTLALTVTACSSGEDSPEGGQSAERTASAEETLAGVCPNPIVIQTDWTPQAEYGAVYRLLGDDIEVDAERGSVSATLVDGGVDTGVRLEIRAGGAVNNYQSAASFVHSDEQVILGTVDIDGAVQLSAEYPMQAVFAPMELSPLVLLWDPETYPQFQTIADIGQTDTTVLYFPGSTYIEFLVGAGILRRSQIDSSYDGSPSRFVAEQGRIVQQGYLTNEVYSYPNELEEWNREVGWALVSDAGYPNYPAALGINPERREELAPCLERLVPMLQRAARDYAADPEPTNELIVELVDAYNGYPYTPERAAYAVDAMLEHGILSNGHNDTVGDFDMERVQQILDIVRPIFIGQRVEIAEDLTAEDLATNEFIDESIGLEPSQ